MRRIAAILGCTAVLGACGDPSAVRTEGSPASEPFPARLDVVCGADGSTELLNEDVRALPDGVRVQVDNRAGEFVSLNGTALDFDEGVTEQVASLPPGQSKIACWPASMHTDPEPELLTVQVHDPESHWVNPKVECSRDSLVESATFDFVSHSGGTEGDPEDIARERLEGLQPDDMITRAGYPESEHRSVAVERDEETIAALSFSPVPKGWAVAGYSACAAAGIGVGY